jgi:hypothetical protein
MRSRTVRRFGLPLLVGVSVIALMGAQCQPNKPPEAIPVGIALAGVFDLQDVIGQFSEDAEILCSGGEFVGGYITTMDGEVDLLGPVRAFLSTYWDFFQTPPGNFTPDNPTLALQATVTPGGYTSCTNGTQVTGQADLETANGTINGDVTGGEAYQTSATGREVFVAVNVTGGTGVFQGATGGYVLHVHTNFANGDLLSGEIEGEVILPA